MSACSIAAHACLSLFLLSKILLALSLYSTKQLTSTNSTSTTTTTTMPKEKTTRKAAPKSKADGGKKKKGK